MSIFLFCYISHTQKILLIFNMDMCKNLLIFNMDMCKNLLIFNMDMCKNLLIFHKKAKLIDLAWS